MAQGAWDEMVAQQAVRSAMHVKGDEGQQEKQQQLHQLQQQQQAKTQPPQLTATVDVSSPPSSFSSSTSALLASPTSAGQSDASDAALSPKKERRVDSNSIVSEEVSTVGTVGLAVYAALFRSAGGYLGYLYAFFVLVVLMLTGQGVSITSDRWLAIWSSQSASAQGELLYEDVYIGLVLGAIVLGTAALRPLLPPRAARRSLPARAHVQRRAVQRAALVRVQPCRPRAEPLLEGPEHRGRDAGHHLLRRVADGLHDARRHRIHRLSRALHPRGRRAARAALPLAQSALPQHQP